ncbi:MAG: hypothetical protein KDD25_07650 [Bdellovibrionales bacterium]|nr:hypothetical protein [Bdellovibrionales bacterium]
MKSFFIVVIALLSASTSFAKAKKISSCVIDVSEVSVKDGRKSAVYDGFDFRIEGNSIEDCIQSSEDALDAVVLELCLNHSKKAAVDIGYYEVRSTNVFGKLIYSGDPKPVRCKKILK